MPLKKGKPRQRAGTLSRSLESLIDANNEVRVVDAFVGSLDLSALGFSRVEVKQYGSGSYGAALLLKLYLYGYLNRIRSSRRLALECTRNVELWWLLEELKPAYHTIADFRKENALPLKNTFRHNSRLLKEWELYGGQVIAVDGTKLRAQNSKKNNYNQAKIDRHLDYIDTKIEGYFAELDALDQEEDEPPSAISQRREELKQRIKKQLNLDDHYTSLSEHLKRSGERQISTTDEDARALILHRNIVEVGYNIQTVVDDQHNLLVAYEVTKQRDDHALYPMTQAANDILQSNSLAVLADKGYHNGAQLAACEQDNNLQTYVSTPHSKTGPEGFRKADFEYDKASHSYSCPKGQILETNGRWYWKNSGRGRQAYRIQRFTLDYQTCLNCPAVEQCNKGGLKSRHGRYIERSEYDKSIEANAQRTATNPDLYRKRQAIVEHPFGTIKRSWGYSYFLVKGLEKVNGEAALIYLSYNLRRTMSISGIEALLERLKALKMKINRYFTELRYYRSYHVIAIEKITTVAPVIELKIVA